MTKICLIMLSVFKNANKIAWAALIVFGTMTACDDDNEGEDVPAEGTDYVLAVRALGANEESADYLVLNDTLTSGEISIAGQGNEQLGWCYYASAGDTYLSFSYDGNQCVGYTTENGSLVEKGRFVFERADCFGQVDDSTVVIVGAPWGGGSKNVTLQLIDVKDVSIKKSVSSPIYTMSKDDEQNKWPTSIVVRDNKLFLSFYPLIGTTWETPVTDTAYVSIYSYPELEYIKTIKDIRTSPIGYYGASPAMLTTENGDIYTLSCSSYAAGFTQVNKPSGVLRIKNGETEFDKSYFFDVENATEGYKVLTAAYAGNGKAVARVIPHETSADVWNALSILTPMCKLVVLDLINKTVTDVEMRNGDVVEEEFLHGGQFETPFYVEDGQVYVSINNGTETHLYKVNPATATAARGAKILGVEVQAIYKVDND